MRFDPPAQLHFLVEAFKEHKRVLSDPLSIQTIMAGMRATWWLNEQLEAWLGEKNAADTLTLCAPGNVTSEMGLALLDVADEIRPHPDVVGFLQQVKDEAGEDDAFLDELAKLAGGLQAQEAIQAYLEKYGMRCVGEIDITRPRWSERPTTLVPLILDNIRHSRPARPSGAWKQGGKRPGARNKSCWRACAPCQTE
jgi:phosphoenolpyruvate synthase/pyruvate phosphate dikinase